MRPRMPTDDCQYLYECSRCGQQMTSKKGDCCVHSSYGSVPSPVRNIDANSVFLTIEVIFSCKRLWQAAGPCPRAFSAIVALATRELRQFLC